MGFEILYSVRDGKGKLSTTEVNLPTSIDFAQATAFAVAMAQLIDTLITGAITRIGIAFVVDLPVGIKATSAVDSDVEEGARFQFRTSGGFFTSLRLPTFAESRIVAGTDIVNVANPAVAAFITAMVQGIDIDPTSNVVLVAPSDKRGEDITAIEFAREQFLRSRGRVG